MRSTSNISKTTNILKSSRASVSERMFFVTTEEKKINRISFWKTISVNYHRKIAVTYDVFFFSWRVLGVPVWGSLCAIHCRRQFPNAKLTSGNRETIRSHLTLAAISAKPRRTSHGAKRPCRGSSPFSSSSRSDESALVTLDDRPCLFDPKDGYFPGTL